MSSSRKDLSLETQFLIAVNVSQGKCISVSKNADCEVAFDLDVNKSSDLFFRLGKSEENLKNDKRLERFEHFSNLNKIDTFSTRRPKKAFQVHRITYPLFE